MQKFKNVKTTPYRFLYINKEFEVIFSCLKKTMIKRIIYLNLAILGFFFLPMNASANLTNNKTLDTDVDCVIREYDSDVIVNKDSSLLITESLNVDCGTLENKHGIYRALPTRIKLKDKTIKTPIKLISITDDNGNKISHSISYDLLQHTKTWEIGDKNTLINGVNKYKIKYYVYNAIRTENDKFDELYWNLNGNFWEIPIEHYSAEIRLPDEISKDNSKIELYTGFIGTSGDSSGANYTWEYEHTLKVNSTKPYLPREGVTISITMPKIFTPHHFTILELYGIYLSLLIPVFTFYFCLKAWRKYGDDPETSKTIVPEYNIPENLSPIQMGVLNSNGHFNNRLITAGIIYLAVNKYIKIEDISKNGLLKWFTKKDYKLIKLQNKNKKNKLGEAEIMLLDKLFEKSNEIKLSSLKNSFYKTISRIETVAINELDKKDLIEKKGLTYQLIFYVLATIFGVLTIFGFTLIPVSGISALLTTITLVIFGYLMPKRTEKGSEMAMKIKGFKMYMETAEKHRMQFSEKENTFEKLLPYAIAFGMTKLWINKIKTIYGKEYFDTYTPSWLIGSSMNSFNASSFSSSINSISSSISSNISSPSGSSGGGFSGGGGGGGGGGSW